MPSLKDVRQSLVAKVVVRKHVYKVNGRKKKEKENQNKRKGFFANLRKSQKSEHKEMLFRNFAEKLKRKKKKKNAGWTLF